MRPSPPMARAIAALYAPRPLPSVPNAHVAEPFRLILNSFLRQPTGPANQNEGR